MKVFISWSGERSRLVAETLRSWLPTVIQSVKPWMSEADINKGVRWSTELANQLEQTKVGIICLTPDNLNKPWIIFEAGALSKTQPDTFVCTFLLGLEPADLEGPLVQFQTTVADKTDIRRLVQTINTAQNEFALRESQLEKAFELAWPELQRKLEEIPRVPMAERQERSTKEMVKEVLEIIRLQAKEAEARDDDYYKSRDSYMALMIKIFQSALQSSPDVSPEIAEDIKSFSHHASAYYLHKRDINRCPDCAGTGYMVVEGKGARRCEHKSLDELEAREAQSDENTNS